MSDKEPNNWWEHLNMKELEKIMEEMAGAPREEMGKRQPGEKCAYEKYNAKD